MRIAADSEPENCNLGHERVLIRVANKEEHKGILELSKLSPYTKDFSNRLMFSSDASYGKGWIHVAALIKEEDGKDVSKFIGFTCVRHKIREPVTTLYFIGIHPDWQRWGLGKAMLEKIMRAGPHNVMVLNVMKENQSAVQFYQKLHFRIFSDQTLKGHGFGMRGLWDKERWYFKDDLLNVDTRKEVKS